MSKTYDAIIIGAGIGGLTAGNFLAKEGCSTLIIEQHTRPGGCLSSFERKGFNFDAAVHWISQCGEDGVVYKILQELGIERSIEFVQINPLMEVITSNGRYIIPKGRQEAIAYLKNTFPKEAEGIENFFAIQGRITDEMYRLFKTDPDSMNTLSRFLFNAVFPLRFPNIARYYRKKGADIVDSLVKDRDLRRILKIAAIFPNVSMMMLSWFWNVIYNADGYYPKNGMQKVSDVLTENFKRLKGEILYNKKVAKIITEDNQAKGVKLSDNTIINAKAVISNADARQTFFEMLNGDAGAPQKYLDNLKKWRLSESFFYVYLGVDMDLKGSSVNPIMWYFPEKDNFIGIGIPTLSDKGLAPEGRHVVIIGAFGDDLARPWFEKEKMDKEEYKKWKEKTADSLIELADEAIPGIKKNIVVKEAASPLTFNRYTLNSMGASSGWSMDADEQNKLPQRSPIKNLFLAGHWTFNPGGIPSAFMTGRKAAEMVKKAIVSEK
ncbi:MAG: NAD(P)/FAD-dependent oxidoreductase [Nitrospirae bacterium]|nr:NAD(P)/FAD-dependent oxidoreductase [Nitrospirota bacterium]